jgi:CDP-paratose 2-epimerase
MSCIYGPRHFGTEDQGWVAHFMIRALGEKPLTLFGDGRQVRDVLHVGDAVRAYRLVLAEAGRLAGSAFNLGAAPPTP